MVRQARETSSILQTVGARRFAFLSIENADQV
jgi:hypothetical protein